MWSVNAMKFAISALGACFSNSWDKLELFSNTFINHDYMVCERAWAWVRSILKHNFQAWEPVAGLHNVAFRMQFWPIFGAYQLVLWLFMAKTVRQSWVRACAFFSQVSNYNFGEYVFWTKFGDQRLDLSMYWKCNYCTLVALEPVIQLRDGR